MPKNLDFKPQGSLTEMMKLVLGKDKQASFRVNALRMRSMVDVAPTQATMQSHLQLLLAEADHLPQHSGKDTHNFHTRSQPEVEGCGQCREGQQRPREDWKFTSRTEGSPVNSTKPCRNWGTQAGSKAGRTCKFVHDANKLTDQYSRCYVCSSTKHMAKHCDAAPGGKGGSPTKSVAGKPTGKCRTKSMSTGEVHRWQHFRKPRQCTGDPTGG